VIRPNKGGPLGWVIDRYVTSKVRRAFRGVWLRGELPQDDGSLLLYANHPGFWDGFVAHQLCKSAGWDGYCLMDEANLARYRFLARIGAFSVRPGEAASALESFKVARALLTKPRATVVVFPEGVLRPGPGVGPLKRGAEVLARAAHARCLPVAIRYAHFEHELPDILVEAGEAHGPEPLAGFERRLSALVGRVDAARSPDGYRLLVQGRQGVAERWDAVRGAC
jgi:1-acyl-sn-glycerol-3-phosphate acyltransferase